MLNVLFVLYPGLEFNCHGFFDQDDKRSSCNSDSKEDQQIDSIDSNESQDQANDENTYAKSNIVKGTVITYNTNSSLTNNHALLH